MKQADVKMSNEIIVSQPLKLSWKVDGNDFFQFCEMQRKLIHISYENLSPLNDLLISLLVEHQKADDDNQRRELRQFTI